jgi:hypothetical protein
MPTDTNNFKLFVVSLATLAVGGAYYLSLIGFGLPTQNDPLSIRQESANNTRNFRGGSRNFGK